MRSSSLACARSGLHSSLPDLSWPFDKSKCQETFLFAFSVTTRTGKLTSFRTREVCSVQVKKQRRDYGPFFLQVQ